MKVANILFLIAFGTLTAPSCSYAASNPSDEPLEYRQFRETHCLSQEEGEEYYAHQIAEPGTSIQLPSDFVLHGVMMKKNKNFTIGDQKQFSTNLINAEVPAPPTMWEFRYDSNHNPNHGWRSTKYRISCSIKSDSNYPTLGDPGRTTAISNKRLGRPSVGPDFISFPLKDDRANPLFYHCNIVDVYLADDNSNVNDGWLGQYEITRARVNDIVDLIQRSGLIEGVICPANVIQGQDVDHSTEISII